MPNWCTTHYIATGDELDKRSLAVTLNTMPNLRNGFGRYWMGNLLCALGVDEKDLSKIGCRGTFDPDFGARSCFIGPHPDEDAPFKVDADGKMRFSATSAWYRCQEVEEMIMEKYPSIELSWSCTDEFGNFHHTHNPEGYEELEKYETEDEWFGPGEFKEFLRSLRECEGLDIPEDTDEEYIRSEEFEKAFQRWRAKDEDGRYNSYYAVYEDM